MRASPEPQDDTTVTTGITTDDESGSLGPTPRKYSSDTFPLPIPSKGNSHSASKAEASPLVSRVLDVIFQSSDKF